MLFRSIMKQFYLFAVCIIALVSSCIPKSDNKTHFSFTLTPDNEIRFSEIFNNAEYHLLLSEDSVKIDEIECFRVSNHYLGFISSSSSGCNTHQTVYIVNRIKYDMKLQISNQGSEKGQYANLSDLYLGDEVVMLLDKCGKKILVYDYDGTLQNEIETPISAYSF